MTSAVAYVGVNDHDIDLFEGQYIVPNGISYNAYVILDDKIAVMDTVDKRKSDEYLANLDKVLQGRTPDYLVVSHVEPDHASSVRAFMDKYPTATIVGNAKTHQMLKLYFDLSGVEVMTVKEGDTLALGAHTLHFVLAPMVHWPEVMLAYESTEKVLFSADAFGKFGALDADEPWDDEARRYYLNIVGKYGPQVQAVLKKAAALSIETICPLHGPILTDLIPHALEKYNLWSSYTPETDGVLIAYASLHGNTAKAAHTLAEQLKVKGVSCALCDLAREDSAQALALAFQYGKIVLAASSYNASMMPAMEDFLHHLKGKNYQKRTVALMENASWAPSAVKNMKEILGQMKEINIIEPTVTIRGAVKPDDEAAIAALADALSKE